MIVCSDRDKKNARPEGLTLWHISEAILELKEL